MIGRNGSAGVGILVGVMLFALTPFVPVGYCSEPTIRYTVVFEQNIGGLDPGAAVRYQGRDVGQVVSIHPVSDSGTSMQVDIEVLESVPVTTASYAELTFQGLVGEAFIRLAADEAVDATLLTSTGGDYPLIRASNNTVVIEQ